MAGGESRIIVHGGQVVTPGRTGLIDVVIADGEVAELAAPGAADRAGAELIDASGLVILPGVVDAHTHFIQDDPDLFDPDPDEHEGFEAGGRGAAAGGVTTVVEMPQARPPTVDGVTFERKRVLADPDAVVDFALWGGVVQATTAEQIDEQIALGAAGLKAFMCNSDPSFPGVDTIACWRRSHIWRRPGSCWASTPRATRFSRPGWRECTPRAGRMRWPTTIPAHRSWKSRR